MSRPRRADPNAKRPPPESTSGGRLTEFGPGVSVGRLRPDPGRVVVVVPSVEPPLEPPAVPATVTVTEVLPVPTPEEL